MIISIVEEALNMTLKWRVFIIISTLWILGTIGIAIQVSQSTPPTGSTVLIETVKITLLLFGGLGVIMPTYLNIWQSIDNNMNIQQRLEFDKVDNAFNLVVMWDNPALFAARKFSRDLRDERGNISDNDLLKKINENDSLKQSVILIFNYFDLLRISVFYGRADESIVKEALKPVYIDIYQRFYPWIKQQHPQVQRCLEEFYRRWSQ